MEKFVEENYSSLIFGLRSSNESVTISVATNEYSDNVSWDKEMEQFERLAPDIQEKGIALIKNIGKVNWFLHREYEPIFHQLYVVHVDSIRNKMLIISMASNKEDSPNESFCKLEVLLETIELN